MKELRVLQIIDSLNVGGAEVMAVNLSNALVKKNISSFLCVTRKEGPLINKIHTDVKYVFLNKKRKFDLKAIFKLVFFVKRSKIDILHAHGTSVFIAFFVKFLCPNVKLIWHNHCGDYVNLKGVKLKILKSYSKYIDYIISVNQNLVYWGKNILKNKNGSCVANFSILNDNARITTLQGEESKRVVCLAGLRSVKDHINLLKAFKMVVVDNSDWTLHLIGKDYKNNYSAGIIEFIKNNFLEKNVFLYGVCHDINHILSQATIGVLASKSEGLPVSLLEYGLANLAVVVTDVGECGKLVKLPSLVVTAENSDLLFKALNELIISKKQRNIAAKSLKNEVTLNYSEENAMKSILEIYKLK